MKSHTIVADTPRGGRIYLQDVTALAMPTAHYSVVFGIGHITVQFHAEGKRKVSPSKGGVIDIQSKKVTQWAQGATSVTVSTTGTTIIIKRV